MLLTAAELGYKTLRFKDQLILADVVLKRESFLAGYAKPLIHPETFHRCWWVKKYENTKRMNPANTPNALKIKRGENRISYVEKLNKEFPKFLHA